MTATVLIAGGAGYIGSTIAFACRDAGISPVVLDDLSTGRREFVTSLPFFAGDIADPALVRRVFAAHPNIETVVHCAARIVVPDSVRDPLSYYTANVAKTLDLLEALDEVGCRNLVFSSSASIYAPSATLEVHEESPYGPSSPYAWTKFMVERVLEDVAAAGRLRMVSLRYFNPIGADPQLRSGLQHLQPTHALGRLITADRSGRPFPVTGTNWPTRDGSGIRDYVHVWDLAQAHVAAIRHLSRTSGESGYLAVNLGTGTGTTVYELVEAYERVVGHAVEVVPAGRRPGDSAGAFTRSSRARDLLDWTAERSLEDGIADAIRWAKLWPQRLGASIAPVA